MCLFPKQNFGKNRSKILEFECGVCPECLAKRSRYWALRAVYEVMQNGGVGCMLTLTYDSYIRDTRGNVIGERVDTRTLSKPDVQKFIKRLRSRYPDTQIKYIITGERGKRTNRAHYHVLLFGFVFPDIVYYKTSKRGNIIYKSAILNDLWKFGICTVDSINLNAKVARYCTKYCAKDSRDADDTFMLFSRGIGEELLLKQFNGKSYIIDGKEYPIPRTVWQKYILNKYDFAKNWLSVRYIRINDEGTNFEEYNLNRFKHFNYISFRDSDPVYQGYLQYWKNKVETSVQLTPFERILRLDNAKYLAYKTKALQCFAVRNSGIDLPAPRSKRCSGFAQSLGFSRFTSTDLLLLAQNLYSSDWFKRYLSNKAFNKIVDEERMRLEICRYVPCHIATDDSLEKKKVERLSICSIVSPF